MKDVKIRFNTNFPKTSNKKWRVLVDGQQHLVDEIEILCPSNTSQDIVKGDDGQDVEKYHISCKPTSIEFQVDITNFQMKVVLQ